MTCPHCRAIQSDPFWRCPECGETNTRRVLMWAGMALAPACCLASVIFAKDMDIPWKISSQLNWIIPYFPFFGIPFAWLGEGNWVRKMRLSLAYVIFCYGALLFGVVSFLTIRFGLWPKL